MMRTPANRIALSCALAWLAACGEVMEAPDAALEVDATAAEDDPDAAPPVDAAAPDAPPAVYRLGENDAADVHGVTSDTYVSAAEPTANFGARVNFWIDETEPRAALIRFDLSSLPASTAVAEASLQLTTRDDATANSDKTILVYRVLEPWEELSATHTERLAGVDWTAPGVGPGSRGDTAQASFTPVDVGATYAIPLPAQLVEDWLADPTANHGLVLVPTSINGASFHSSQSTDAARRPMLEIRAE